MRYFLFLFCISFCTHIFGQEYHFSENCIKAYNHIIALKADSGRFYLQEEFKTNKDNKIPILLDNYIDFLDAYTKNSNSYYKTKKNSFEQRLKILRKGNQKNPYYLFCQAEVHLQSTVLHIKFGEYFAAIIDVKKSFSKLKENAEMFPSFKANYKSLGTLYTILGSIPEQYQSGLFLFGLSGNVTEGMAMLKTLTTDKTFIFQHETATIYAFLLMHIQNDAKAAWEVLEKNSFFKNDNLMNIYSVGHIGIYGGKNDKGLSFLLQNENEKNYQKFPYLYYLIGIGKTYKLEKDANKYFKKFLEKNEGLDYVKSSYHKMAWNELIVDRKDNYLKYLENVKKSGRAVIDTDKQAEKEANNKKTPNPKLLKVRLLTDGNYLNEALQIMQNEYVTSFKEKATKTEYFYRFARLYDKLGDIENAIKYYDLAILYGKTVNYYFASNAAYLLGFIYENKLNYDKAERYYQLSVDIDGFEYNNSINQKAKAGLNRLKNKL